MQRLSNLSHIEIACKEYRHFRIPSNHYFPEPQRQRRLRFWHPPHRNAGKLGIVSPYAIFTLAYLQRIVARNSRCDFSGYFISEIFSLYWLSSGSSSYLWHGTSTLSEHFSTSLVIENCIQRLMRRVLPSS
jgi:hypothetical protein